MTMEEKLLVSCHNCLTCDVVDNNYLILETHDYIVLDTSETQIDPGQISVQHTVQILDDNVTEKYHETFTLGLVSINGRVRVNPSFDQLTATIVDDDGM